MTEPTFKGFLAFVQGKPSEETYNYWSTSCAFGQYMTELDLAPRIGESTYWIAEGRYRLDDLQPGLADAISANSFTFGALRQRLEALQAGRMD